MGLGCQGCNVGATNKNVERNYIRHAPSAHIDAAQGSLEYIFASLFNYIQGP